MSQYSNLGNTNQKYQSSYLRDAQPLLTTQTPSSATLAQQARQNAINNSGSVYKSTTPTASMSSYAANHAPSNDEMMLQAYMNAQAQAKQLADAKANADVPKAMTDDEYVGEYGSLPVEPTNPGTDNGGGSNGGGSVDNSAPANDYWSQYYAALQAEQERQRQQAQEAYYRTLENIENSYNSSKGVINQNADEALRQAYINSQLSRKGLTNELANQGINGGATESILANLLNAYGNNRNSIEQQRANNLTSLRSNYDSAVADAGNVYANGLGNIDQNYSNALASGLLNQAQSADSLRNALASRSGGSSSALNTVTPTSTTYDRATVLKGLKNYADDFDNADAYMRQMGVPESDLQSVYLEAGLGNYDEAKNQAAVNNFNRKISGEDLNTILRNLGQMGNVYNGDVMAKNYMDQIVDLYKLTDDEARYLLAQARI